MSGYIAWLDSPEECTSARVGGKASSLARLAGAGFPVPPGFAVTVESYREFHEAHAIGDHLDSLAAIGERPSSADVRDACAPLIARLEGAGLPAVTAEAVRAAVAALLERTGPGATFAVRSSGVNEDGSGNSFAGLYESFLNLTGEDQVVAAVEDCYRCLWQPRAVHYRTMKKVSHTSESMAVAVMQTVYSEVSGVAFSRNPVTGADEVVINASWGLGESIVSGTVTPDNYVASRGGEIRSYEVFEKEVRVVLVAGGTEQQATPPELVSRPAMSHEQVSHVATTVAAVEEHYGCPIDVEFAYDADGRFYVLQARPITTI